MKKIITQGEVLPRFYGLAYPELWSMTYVCYPFPLNHLVRICRTLWLRIRNAKITKMENTIIQEINDARIALLKRENEIKKDRQDFEEYKLALFEALKSITLPQ
jgi:hypothetical protein